MWHEFLSWETLSRSKIIGEIDSTCPQAGTYGLRGGHAGCSGQGLFLCTLEMSSPNTSCEVSPPCECAAGNRAASSFTAGGRGLGTPGLSLTVCCGVHSLRKFSGGTSYTNWLQDAAGSWASRAGPCWDRGYCSCNGSFNAFHYVDRVSVEPPA